MDNNKLFDFITSDQNIYTAIYSLKSYVFEKGLLSDCDIELFTKLQDKYNFELISEVINKCKKKLNNILNEDKFFNIQVYFKMKKYENEKIIYRPIHTTDLITQICIVSLLNIIVFDDSKGKRELSDVSELFPSNFYGNIPSTDVKNIFFDWHDKYKEYSQKIIDSYNKYEKTGEYKYEVCLDLENFFPSINPNVIYNILLNKLSVVFKDDIKYLRIILKKLLFFNISNISRCYSKYYPMNEEEFTNDKRILEESIKKNFYPSLGIPQGLPQAYYFGNVCMAEIAKEINKKFDGKSFYYVDDSVIYTNNENAKSENFENAINDLNNSINNIFKNIIDEKCKENIFNHYKIKIHKGGKSICSDIQHDKKYGRRFLKQINLGVSTIPFDISTAIDEFQDQTIREKTELFSNAIEKEIELIKNKIQSHKCEENITALKSYLKLLRRYKKFFLYRLKIIKFSHDDIKDTDLNNYYKKYHIDDYNELSNKDIENIFEIFDEDIFIAEANLFLKFSNTNHEKENIFEKISGYESKLSKEIPKENLYYSKTLKLSFRILEEHDIYKSLKNMKCKYLKKYKKYSRENILKNILQLIKENENYVNYSEDDKIIFWGYYLEKYSGFVMNNSNDFKRLILNCLFSKLFSVDVSNKSLIIKLDNRTLEYYELRILMYLRNKYSNFDKTILFIKEIINEGKKYNTHDKIDYSIMEVLNIFRIYVKNPDYIDQLIITHKYVMSVWKNGSKHLYFYTLHNQEHSVELIKSSISICKSIDFLKIKAIDFYVLFLACYLHDISMILQPNFSSFITDENDAELLFTEWKEEYKIIEKEKFNISENILIKKFILDFYKKVDAFFENEIRSNHTRNSAEFIKKTHDLDYIDCAIKNIVANVSEAHGFNENDVYGLKSKGQSDVINIKFLMILIRLADLMDMSKDRVSLNIMKLNIEQMNKVSQFHWISHAAIDSCTIKSKYYYNPKDSSCLTTYLDKNFLNESIEVHLYLNSQNLMAVTSNKNCSNVKCILNEGKDEISLKILNETINSNKCNKTCNFMCKWMMVKNIWLVNELKAISIYLSRNKENNFNTDIYLKIHMQNTGAISQEYLDIVSDYIKE
ncbi:hypothetical protein QTH16_10880 [Clostridium perfringens]|uniref:HD domain-containing protein n=1 Tax=Clostridium perfringens TaxID=1502 RepID=UPI0024BC6FDC|nr:reverse transcriptase domain-containing protein [Clostridium perfringens]MDK0979660.1 hypothetical protein [Clostridium perfringens]MDM0455153.1 hypothetical protein [Clostridium perfringens]